MRLWSIKYAILDAGDHKFPSSADQEPLIPMSRRKRNPADGPIEVVPSSEALPRRGAPVLRFILIFAVVAAASLLVEFWCMSTNSARGYRHVVAAAGGGIARFLGNDVTVDGSVLSAGARLLDVTPECAAIDALGIFLAGVLAFPGPWRVKALGAIVGLALIFAANVLRIAFLTVLAAARPATFNQMHEALMHLFPLFVVLPLWLAWVLWVVRARGGRKPAASAVTA